MSDAERHERRGATIRLAVGRGFAVAGVPPQAFHNAGVEPRGRVCLAQDPLEDVGGVGGEEVLDEGEVALGGELRDVLCGPAAEQDVQLEPAALAGAVDDAAVARRDVGRDLRAGLRRGVVLGEPGARLWGRSRRGEPAGDHGAAEEAGERGRGLHLWRAVAAMQTRASSGP